MMFITAIDYLICKRILKGRVHKMIVFILFISNFKALILSLFEIDFGRTLTRKLKSYFLSFKEIVPLQDTLIFRFFIGFENFAVYAVDDEQITKTLIFDDTNENKNLKKYICTLIYVLIVLIFILHHLTSIQKCETLFLLFFFFFLHDFHLKPYLEK